MAMALSAGFPAVSNPPKAPLAYSRPGTVKSQKEAIGSHGERARGVGCGVVAGAVLLTRRSKLQMRAAPAVKERAELQSQRRADQEAFARGYESASSEECFTLHSEDLPKGLRGTYYRNGPAKLKVGKDQIKHPFDGDGMVAAVTFDGQGNVHFRNRFVRTPGFVEELEAQKMLYRGQFSPKSGGWLANAFDMRVKNLANTNVMHWAGRLFALWEGGKPMELDPLSVATLGQGSFAGALKSEDNFTAHPRFDARTGRQVGFQYQPDIPNSVTNVSFWEFEPSGFSTARRVNAQIPDFGFYHDFLVTENYYILSKAPVSISPQGALEGMLGFRSMGESIRFDASKPTQLALVPRDGSEPRFIDLDTHFCFHFGNGYEEDGKLIIDMAFAASLELGDASSGDRPVLDRLAS
ncbi:Apocarotenoid-15,15'-oxygenase [Symbiodinium microadriaticum]|uniref:Apocarotenoid-15,15'-oxygenase n=1 Tax=Symbiodinium microadriaticum TaxID=2951 RepID=A0A1Q9F4K5_SYMMI|nr:Apocarotenoid-15,15'-oxygenase [Symbiodinium microadriaticum]